MPVNQGFFEIINHFPIKRYIITHGFTKKTQKTPVNEIKHAEVLKKEFEENNNG